MTHIWPYSKLAEYCPVNIVKCILEKVHTLPSIISKPKKWVSCPRLDFVPQRR